MSGTRHEAEHSTLFSAEVSNVRSGPERNFYSTYDLIAWFPIKRENSLILDFYHFSSCHIGSEILVLEM